MMRAFSVQRRDGLVELVSIGPSAPAALLTSIATSGATAFLIIMAMSFGLILPRMLFERVLPARSMKKRHDFYAPQRVKILIAAADYPYQIVACPGIVECFHDYSSDQIVPQEKPP